MTMRALRLFTARLLIGLLLCTQLGLAWKAQATMLVGVVAPTPNSMSTALPSAADRTGVRDMDGMAAEKHSSSFMANGSMVSMTADDCLAHCLYDQELANRSQGPVLPAAFLTRLYQLPALAQLASMPQGLGEAPPGRDPPHAILHCCLRI